jgi:predicted ATPase
MFPSVTSVACACPGGPHVPRFVALTGGPGAGKTATLEVMRKSFCPHVVVLPEAASILFGGGFPRRPESTWRAAAQRAIYHVQHELQRAVAEAREAAVVLCDRGTVDGLAYWLGPERAFWDAVHSSRERELRGYAAVFHLRPPPADGGYDRANPLRIESAVEAAAIDARIAAAWDGHPRRFFVDSHPTFLAKLAAVIEHVRGELPPCCRSHVIPELAASASS